MSRVELALKRAVGTSAAGTAAEAPVQQTGSPWVLDEQSGQHARPAAAVARPAAAVNAGDGTESPGRDAAWKAELEADIARLRRRLSHSG